jgi:hypothetical protein
VGFNKKIVGEETIQKINSSLEIIDLYLRADLLIFESQEVKKKFQELRDEFLKTNTIS